MNASLTSESVVVSRLINASRPRVFAAWSTPEIANWICTGERQIISAKVDFRVGGEYNIHLVTDHGDVKFSGTYREIKAPSRIVFTWTIGECIPEFAGLPSQVTVDLAEQQGGTLVTITHDGLPAGEIRDKHAEGWNLSLDNLEKIS